MFDVDYDAGTRAAEEREKSLHVRGEPLARRIYAVSVATLRDFYLLNSGCLKRYVFCRILLNSARWDRFADEIISTS
jgi:hypothetical protein